MSVELPLASSVSVPPRAAAGLFRLPALPDALWAGLIIIGAWCVASVMVPALSGRDAEQVVYGARLLAPSAEYLFGTDSVGRDVLVRTAVAFRYDFLVASLSVLLAAVCGVLIGAFSGSAPEWFDNVIMRVLDVIASFPSFVLAIALTVALGPSVPTLVVAIGRVLLPLHARDTRAAILAERSKPYADAARAMAIPPARIVLVHLLPNSLRPTITQMAIDMSNAIMRTATLSFLGFGIQSPTPEWGLMMNDGAAYIINGQWWVTFFPGLAILSIVPAFFLLDVGVKRLQS